MTRHLRVSAHRPRVLLLGTFEDLNVESAPLQVDWDLCSVQEGRRRLQSREFDAVVLALANERSFLGGDQLDAVVTSARASQLPVLMWRPGPGACARPRVPGRASPEARRVSPVHVFALFEWLQRELPSGAGIWPVLRHGDVELEVARYRARRAGRDLEISVLQLRCLHLMLLWPRHVFSFDELHHALWTRGRANEKAIRAAMLRLRRALALGGECDLVRSVYREGYVFDPDEDALRDRDAAAQDLSSIGQLVTSR